MKWINLRDNTTGGKLKFARTPDGVAYLVITGLAGEASKFRIQNAIQKLGFSQTDKGTYLVKRWDPTAPRPTAEMFRQVWPNAMMADMAQSEIVIDLNPATSLERARQSEEVRRINAETAGGMRRLGRNAQGDLVYQSVLGRCIAKEGGNFIYESKTLRPELFLRMNAADPESMRMCSDGFIQSMLRNEAQHAADFEGFLAAIHGTETITVNQKHQAFYDIETAVIAYLKNSYGTANDAFGDSVRLYDFLPPFPTGVKRGHGAMPYPLSIIAQRLLGDTSDKTVLYPNAFDGAAFAFLPEATKVLAFQGQKNLQAVSETIDVRADVKWGEQFNPSDVNDGVDAIFFNADPRLVSGVREDYGLALKALSTLRPGGRAVMVLAGDDAAAPGEILQDSRGFIAKINEQYRIDDAFEINPVLTKGVGTQFPLRVLVLTNRLISEEQRELPVNFPVLSSWDDVKTRVDETIERINLKEAEADSIDLESVDRGNEYQRRYIAFSKVGEATTMTPKNLQGPIQTALSNLEQIHGPIDDYVCEKLGFGANTLSNRFSPEQVDAIGLMVAKFEIGRGFILGDDTGIGKGRQISGAAVYAQKRNKTVFFVTDRSNLFSDIARDLKDIGEWGRFSPLVVNSDGVIIDMFSEEQDVLAEGTKLSRMAQIIDDGRMVSEMGYNMVMLTYSQISGEASPKTKWFLSQMQNSLLILDEAHLAAGSDSNVASVISEAAGACDAVLYSSGTWAKTPENLHIFHRALPQSINMESLTRTIRRGGESFMEIFSAMLARDGAMIRREHDLSRLVFKLVVDGERRDRNLEWAGRLSEVLGQMAYVSGEVNKLLMRTNSDSMRALRQARDAMQGMKTSKIFRSTFGTGSAAYITMRRLLAALNADNAADLALKAVADNMKPVVVFDDTAEAFVNRMIEKHTTYDEKGNAILPEAIPAPTIKDLLLHLMKRLGVVAVRNARQSDIYRDETQAERILRREREKEAKKLEKLRLNAAQTTDLAADATVRSGIVGIDSIGMEEEPTDGHIEEQARTEVMEGVARAIEAQGTPEGVDLDEMINEMDVLMDGEYKVQIEDFVHQSPEVVERYKEGMEHLLSLIEAMPDIPIIPADVVRNRLIQGGLRVGEISGRRFQLNLITNDMDPACGLWRIKPRAKTKRDVIRTAREFNSYQLDAAVINTAAATGLSLHSSPRFVDQRRRVMVEIQCSENPNTRIQLYGRVNRFDQVLPPHIIVSSSGILGEVRQTIMNNYKIRSLSANTRSSPEHAALIRSVRDLINPIGKEVCRTFLMDNPGILSRFGVSYEAVESNTVDCGNLLTRYVVLFHPREQERIYEEVNQMYDDALMRYELQGMSPLKAKELDIRAKVTSSMVMMGADQGLFGSAFSGPVYLKKLAWSESYKRLNFEEVKQLVCEGRNALIQSGRVGVDYVPPSGEGLPKINLRDLAAKAATSLESTARIALGSTKFRTIQEALADKSGAAGAVLRSWARKSWVENNLAQLVPGAVLSFHVRGLGAGKNEFVRGILTSVYPPKEHREGQLSSWRFELVQPGDQRPVMYTLGEVLDRAELIDFSDFRTPNNAESQAQQVERAAGDGAGPVGAQVAVDNAEGDLEDVHVSRAMDIEILDAMVDLPVQPAEEMSRAERVALRDLKEIRNQFRDQGPRIMLERSAYVMEGNMYMAAEWAAATNAGKSIIYTNERGVRQRAIMLSSEFNFDLMRYMPVRLWSPRQISAFLAVVSQNVLHAEESGNQGFVRLHTTFRGAVGRSDKSDVLFITNKKIRLDVDKKSINRMSAAIRRTQERLINEHERALAIARNEEFIPLRKFANHPDYMTVLGSSFLRTEGGKKERSKDLSVGLEYGTPEKFARAVQILSEACGLEIYVTDAELRKVAFQVLKEGFAGEMQENIRMVLATNPQSEGRVNELIDQWRQRIKQEAEERDRLFDEEERRRHAERQANANLAMDTELQAAQRQDSELFSQLRQQA